MSADPARLARLAREVMSRPTAPFREEAVIQAVRAFAAERPGLALAADPDGNLILSLRRAKPSPRPLVFVAHMDHPGFHSRAGRRTPAGYRFEAAFLGGVMDRWFPGSRARFFHGDGSTAARVLSVRADRASGDKRAVLLAPRPVPAGVLGMWDLPAFKAERGSLVSRAVDDLGGVTAVLGLFDRLARAGGRAADVRGLLTRAEEVGFIGAVGAAARKAFPKEARIVSIETSKALPHAPQGAGPIVRVGDRASVFDDGLTRWACAAAARLEKKSRGRFRWQRKLMDGGTCEGTAFQAFGYKTAALCVPLANYHNMGDGGKIRAETIRLSDLAGLVELMAAMAEDAPPPASPRDRLLALHDARRAALREAAPAPSFS